MTPHDAAPATRSPAPEDHDLGLSHDLPTLLSRRSAMTLLGGAGAAFLAACGAGTTSTTSSSAGPSGGTTSTTGTASQLIPEETAGPYPGDGSNGVDVLDDSGIVRSDITSSVDVGSATADGVPLALRLRVLDVSGGTGAPLAGAAVYAWHADAQGRYSMYSQGLESENYLRGVQVTDADGWVSFASVFPGCYDGRWPHVHFEVYPDVGTAVAGGSKLRTSQLAFPEGTCSEVYADPAYPDSASNLGRVSLDGDMVFADGYSLQLATMSGAVGDGLTATLAVPV